MPQPTTQGQFKLTRWSTRLSCVTGIPGLTTRLETIWRDGVNPANGNVTYSNIKTSVHCNLQLFSQHVITNLTVPLAAPTL